MQKKYFENEKLPNFYYFLKSASIILVLAICIRRACGFKTWWGHLVDLGLRWLPKLSGNQSPCPPRLKIKPQFGCPTCNSKSNLEWTLNTGIQSTIDVESIRAKVTRKYEAFKRTNPPGAKLSTNMTQWQNFSLEAAYQSSHGKLSLIAKLRYQRNYKVEYNQI